MPTLDYISLTAMTHTQFIRILRSEVDKAPSRWRAAERLGISESMLSRVLRGKQQPNDSLLAHYGLKRQTVYVPNGEPTT